jgi:hypothetical protein
MTFSKDKRHETIIYLVLWSLLFIAPVLSLYIRTATDADAVFDWHEVFIVWRQYAVFLVIFLIHNHLLAPLLVYRQKKVLYLTVLAVLVALFTVYQCTTRPSGLGRHGGPPPHEMKRPDFRDKPDFHENADFPAPPRHPEFPDNRRPSHKPGHRPPVIIGQHDIVNIVILILLLGANLGIKLYFRNQADRKRLDKLEKENLEQQLEYLRYQINPHFLMNTLNNIHALVDIEPAKAQDTILELSRMMRFVLYEGNKQRVPLTKELDFIRTYVALMQLRYTDKVSITLDMPTGVPDRSIPPLLLITFIENAFKHGVSYQWESFIKIKVMIENDRLCFHCTNSKADRPNEEKGGVGLVNVRKRLNLLYAHDYSLRIQDTPEIYTVELNIPLS